MCGGAAMFVLWLAVVKSIWLRWALCVGLQKNAFDSVFAALHSLQSCKLDL